MGVPSHTLLPQNNAGFIQEEGRGNSPGIWNGARADPAERGRDGMDTRYRAGAAAPSHCSHPNGSLSSGTPGFTSEKTKLGAGLANTSRICVWKGWESGHTESREERAQAQQRVPFPAEPTPKHSLFSNTTCTCFPPRCSKHNNLH